jgi:hypothetical protein
MKTSLYDTLKTKKKQEEVTEDVYVKPLDSFETIIACVNYALGQSDEIDDLIEEEMKECMASGMAPEATSPMIFPLLIATFPTFCLFELGNDTYRCDYKYDKKTRNVTLGTPTEVTLDVTMMATPENDD